ncbi:MAG: FtsK/SpoIIIE domain-containing protein [Actinomycetota bacterium]
MEISIIGEGGVRRDVTVALRGEVSIGDVVGTAGVAASVTVDGRPVEPAASFVEVCRPGSTIDTTGAAGARDVPRQSGRHTVRVTGGPDAGTTHTLGDRSEIVVGRSSRADVVLDDPTVSPIHARLYREGDAWEIEDLGSHNGTTVGGEAVLERRRIEGRVIRVGATSIMVGPADVEVAHVTRPGLDGTTPFNRPPRPVVPAGVPPIEVPDPPADRRRGAAFSLIALAGPVVIGLVMVQVLGSMRYALFALLAPVMMISNALATRRRNAKEAKSSARRFRRELAAFERDLDLAAATEAARRQRSLVDLASIVARAEGGSVRLWERRAHHPDHLGLRLGSGSAPWDPPVDAKRVAAHPELGRAVAARGRIPGSALELSLASGGVVGLVGDRSTTLAVARSLVAQAAVLHGPSDLGVAVAAGSGRGVAWDWVKWLPHTRASGGRLLAEGVDQIGALAEGLSEALDIDGVDPARRIGAPTRAPLLFVVDGDELTTAHRAPARTLLQSGPGVAGIVLAASAERLPSSCTVVVHLDDDLGAATCHDVGRDEFVDDVVIDGLGDSEARCVAMAMAHFTDPDLRSAGSDLPGHAALVDLLGLERCADGGIEPGAIGRAWADSDAQALEVPLGVGPDGPIWIDLVADGPHALVGGTTGAGKSEFLRSLVAGSAARHRPEDLVFVLIDYKGGSAFDSCATLPHTVGLVTDLDGHLAERALRSLRAELHRREEILRAAGAGDLREYRRTTALEPMPRLMLVVDEFATLASELPDFMSSLVGIAQRGRSLGVHMVLATQRPAGAVNADIKANTNVRVALRMQSDRDSVDVIDADDAASIDRRSPGRAFVRLGPGELLPVQTPLATSTTVISGPTVAAAPFGFGPGLEPLLPRESCGIDDDLAALVRAIGSAHVSAGGPAPRRPWLEPLTAVSVDQLLNSPGADAAIPVALADDPDRQCRPAACWDPGLGHLALVGAVGAGTSTALRTVALSAASSGATSVVLYAVDYGGVLADLEALECCGAVIRGHDHERQRRLVDLLGAEIATRRGALDTFAERPLIVLLIDDLPAWLADHGDNAGQELIDDVRRLLADGPAVDVSVAFTADRAGAVPMRMWGAVTSRFLFRHADPDELTSTGLRRHELPEFIPGRAIDASSRLVVQFPGPTTSAAWPAPPPCGVVPAPVRALPERVSPESLSGTFEDGDGTWSPAVGIGADDLAAARLPLRPGEGVLVAGPARSGVSSTLALLARQVRVHRPDAVLVAVADAGSPLAATPGLFDAVGPLGDLAKVLEVAGLDDEREWLVLVDDAHVHDEPGALEPLLRPDSRCRMVVGARSEHLHGSFGHWTRAVRRTNTGLLLNPRLDTDGDLLGVRLPRHVAVPLRPGRGFLVDRSDAEIVQLAA